MPTQQFLVTTEAGFEGYQVISYLGVVRGLGLRVITWSGAVGSVIGHNSNNPALFLSASDHAYWEATDLVIKQATQMNANALIGMRYDSNEVIPGVCQILAYGTAVVIQPKP